MIEAAFLLDCCGTCTNSQDAISAAEALLEMLENGMILVEDGGGDPDPSWLAKTEPDCVFGNTRVFNTENDNFIALNDTHMGAGGHSSDPIAAAIIMAAILTHEYVHCVTLENSYVENVGWDDECSYWANEITCYIIEQSIVDCIVNCSCVNVALISPAGLLAIQDQQVRVASQLQAYTDAYSGGC